MDRKSYEDGRTGQSSGPNTDINSYRAGQAEREAGEYKPGLEGGGQKTESDAVPLKSYNTQGAPILGLFAIVPFLVLIYPAGGILSVLALAGLLKGLMALGVRIEAVIIVAVITAIPAFGLGIWVERKMSTHALYRMIRHGWRVWAAIAALLQNVYVAGRNSAGAFEFDLLIKNTDKIMGGMGMTVVFIVIAWWLIQKADRIYFPYPGQETEVTKASKSTATVESKPVEVKPRSLLTRILMSLVWFVPVAFVAHMVIRILVDGYFQLVPDGDNEKLRKAFYGANLMWIVVADVAIWLALSIAGILPGTGKRKP